MKSCTGKTDGRSTQQVKHVTLVLCPRLYFANKIILYTAKLVERFVKKRFPNYNFEFYSSNSQKCENMLQGAHDIGDVRISIPMGPRYRSLAQFGCFLTRHL